ncbi:MAG: hypothetical protein A2Z38_06905 [Planctomycetes bacterium RBG_19FT_COMBO_48_8]|nr:MAG: hypothetical protein A2Z38_06905 [Planctomycetes bacterium RBG_19FT_COMBO_48_8]
MLRYVVTFASGIFSCSLYLPSTSAFFGSSKVVISYYTTHCVCPERKNSGLLLHSDSHGANVNPKVSKILKKQKNRSELGNKTLKIRKRKKT